jgi:hypothetical protein
MVKRPGYVYNSSSKLKNASSPAREGLKSVNLQYNTVERRVDGTIVPPSDGPMFILIDWE